MSILLCSPNQCSTAQIDPKRGFNCWDWVCTHAGQPVTLLDAEPGFPDGAGRPSASGIPLLFPFPNRIRNGVFQWRGQSFSLPTNDRNRNAIHGFVHERPWRVIERGSDFACGEFHAAVDDPTLLSLWPADFRIRCRYHLADRELRCDTTVDNPGDTPLPWGFGTHSYFRTTLAADSSPSTTYIQVPASELWELEACLPTGRTIPVSSELDLRLPVALQGLELDHVYTSVSKQNGVVTSRVIDKLAGIAIVQRTPELFRELVAYTPPHGRSVCIEPYTCVTDAINLAERGVETGWQVLPPGASVQTWFTLTLEPFAS